MSKQLKWFLCMAIIKLAIFFLFAWQFNVNRPGDLTGYFFVNEGDTPGYYEPIENLINGYGYSHLYTSDESVQEVPTGLRMPGLLPVYGPLYFLFGDETGKTLTVFIQLILSILSIYYIGKIAEYLFKDQRAFFISSFIYTISTFVSIYDHFGLADSIHSSTLIFSIYFFTRFLSTYLVKYFFLSGVFIAWSIFMRPVAGVFLVLIPIIYGLALLNEKKSQLMPFIRNSVIFGSTCLILLTIWTYRNHRTFDEFIPLQRALYKETSVFSRARLAIYDFIRAQGEDMVNFYPNTLGSWFFNEPAGDFDLDQLIYTPGYNKDSIINLRRYYFLSRDKELSDKIRSEYENQAILLSGEYTNSIRKNAPGQYYFYSRVKLLVNFLFPRLYSSPLPFPALSDMHFVQILIKAGYWGYFYLLVIMGLSGIALSYKKKKFYASLFSLLPLSLIFVLACYFGYIELRYFIPVYIFMTIFATYSIINLLKFPRKWLQKLKPIKSHGK